MSGGGFGRAVLYCPDEAAMSALGERLAPRLRAGDILALSGPLGAGKSVLARAIIRARHGDSGLAVPSPSFTLVQIYEPAGGPAIWHADLLRLEDAGELVELGLDAAEDAILLVEWPEHAGDALPGTRLDIDFETLDGDVRRLTLRGPAARLRELGLAGGGS